MTKLKLLLIALFAALAAVSCFRASSGEFVIANSKSYEASLFRQQCAICHGPEGNGRTLDDGRVVPSLRSGEFKFRSEAEIQRQISNGGNGMTPFRGILTEREIDMMTKFVHDQLRSVK